MTRCCQRLLLMLSMTPWVAAEGKALRGKPVDLMFLSMSALNTSDDAVDVDEASKDEGGCILRLFSHASL